jgi:hypothetical protein
MQQIGIDRNTISDLNVLFSGKLSIPLQDISAVERGHQFYKEDAKTSSKSRTDAITAFPASLLHRMEEGHSI